MTDTAAIAEAFSRTAEKYDAFGEEHPHLLRLRSKVYAHLDQLLKPGSRILELNAGSGTDAVELARRGYRVHATDIAPGMLARAREKVQTLGLSDKVTVQECSFTELDRVAGAPFDAVFSNLGGLNCVPDLEPVVQQLPRLVAPGGYVTCVIMPPVCLWEMADVFRGRFRVAFRRVSRTGTLARLEGLRFTVHYFSPSRVESAFGPQYRRVALEGLSVLTPTAESKDFAKRHTSLYRLLCRLDDAVSGRARWSGWGDFYILSLRYEPGDRRR